MSRPSRILVYCTSGRLTDEQIRMVAARWSECRILPVEDTHRIWAHVWALRPDRVVIIDEAHLTPLRTVRLISMFSGVTVYNENLDSFDIDDAHKTIIKEFFYQRRPNFTRQIRTKGMHVFILLKAGMRLVAVGWGRNHDR